MYASPLIHPSKSTYLLNENEKNGKDQFQIDSFPYCIALFPSIGLTRDNGDEFIFIHAAQCPDNRVFSIPQISFFSLDFFFELNFDSFGYQLLNQIPNIRFYYNHFNLFKRTSIITVVDETSSKKLIVKFSIIINYRWKWRWKD